MIVALVYIGIFTVAWAGVVLLRKRRGPAAPGATTFGEEAAVRPDRLASVLSVLTVCLIWGAFTGSRLVPVHVPGPFTGLTAFTYTARNAAGMTDQATVRVHVHALGAAPRMPQVVPGSGFARDDAATIAAWRSGLIRVAGNDVGGQAAGYRVIAVDGQPIAPGGQVMVADGRVGMTPKGTLSFMPDRGWRIEPIWLPAPETVALRLLDVARNGFQNVSLWEHLGWSLWRVIAGFSLGSLLGIPLGYAMGLSGWVRGWFDPVVEFMRPVPPLALIPLVIIWFGIWETGKIVLLFLAALWIMIIAARAGVSGIPVSKLRAALSLGASRRQILRHVIVPNSLPEIFTGARVAMGVCWGTVVAAELVAAQKGAGMMIIAASKFQMTDVVILGIALIGGIGYGIDLLIRWAERRLVPWKGQG
ncbi:MAG: ABC transporter permease [Qingshengfaniella sp.]